MKFRNIQLILLAQGIANSKLADELDASGVLVSYVTKGIGRDGFIINKYIGKSTDGVDMSDRDFIKDITEYAETNILFSEYFKDAIYELVMGGGI